MTIDCRSIPFLPCFGEDWTDVIKVDPAERISRLKKKNKNKKYVGNKTCFSYTDMAPNSHRKSEADLEIVS